MTEPAYPAARAVASTVEAYFERLHATAPQQGEQELAPLPEAKVVQAIIDAAFWASLRREEGYAPRISLALLPPERAGQRLTFERSLPLTPAALTRLAPAVERPGIRLGVWHDRDALSVWGATRALPLFCFVLEVVQPGLLVVKYRRAEEFAKFGNVAVLDGDRIKVVDERGGSLPDCPPLITSLVGSDSPLYWADPVDVLVQLALSMRAHGRGGSLLVVPDDTQGWEESILQPVRYAVVPPFSGLAELVRRSAVERSQPPWQEAFRRVVDAVAGLTAVDGAAVITDRYHLLAFGAKIRRAKESTPVEAVIATEPVVGDEATVVALGELGGTRHSSAAQFVHDQRDALALVASQDGRFTIFAWSPSEEKVHAHRVETLLL